MPKPYTHVRLIGFKLNTAPIEQLGKKIGVDNLLPLYETSQRYVALANEEADLALRCSIMEQAIDVAAKAVAPPSGKGEAAKDASCLKVFVAPEFFFRGVTGAYSMESYQKVVERLRSFTRQKALADWLFVFGSAIAQSQTHDLDVGSGVKEQTIYNVVFVQRGNQGEEGSHVVMKDFMSGIDFLRRQRDLKDATGKVIGRAKDGTVDSRLMVGDVQHLPSGKAKVVIQKVTVPDPLHIGQTKEIEKKVVSYTQVRGRGQETQNVSYSGLGLFTVDGVTLAVEICLDHACRRMWRSPPAVGQARAQLHIVPSCGMTIHPESVVTMPGGYVFNCDGLGNGAHLDARQVKREIDPMPQPTGKPPSPSRGFLKLAKIDLTEQPLLSAKEGLPETEFEKCFQASPKPVIAFSGRLALPAAQLCQGLSETANPHWVPDDATHYCYRCESFIAMRKHHCRVCGRVVCDDCSPHQDAAANYGYSKPVRTCAECHQNGTGWRTLS